jgi:hypothetical protein
VNGLTSGFLERAKIPITLANDRAAVAAAFDRLSPEQRARPRVARVRDTLHVAEFEASPALVREARVPLEEIGTARPLAFDGDGALLHSMHRRVAATVS